jgi:large subunit ribosomal protein L10e
MAAIRPGRCYHYITKPPWTRISIRRPRRSYVKGVPASKIHQFETGNVKGQNDFPLTYYLITGCDIQMRSNCLEAARMAATKWLEKHLGATGFFLKILPYPHHVLRENAMATGAGADRYSEGMRQSFGKPVGQAARLKKSQRVIMIRTPSGNDVIIKEALRRASTKLPSSCRIVAG